MSIKNNQIEIPFTQSDKDKLDAVPELGPVASQAEAEAGTDNIKTMTPLRTAQAIAALAPTPTGSTSYLSAIFTNGSGSTIPALTLVTQNASGNIEFIDPSVELDVINIIGLLLQETANGVSGEVATSGIIKNISTSFSIGDVLFVSKSGELTTTTPEIGIASFAVGDLVIRAGKITKNSTTPTNKDFILNIDVIGAL